MNKEQKSIVAEYSSMLSEEDLCSLTTKLTDRFPGDMAEALDEMSKDRKMDSVLASAESAEAFFNIVDQVRDVLQKECKKRGISFRLSPV